MVKTTNAYCCNNKVSPCSVAVDVESPRHQDDDHRADRFAFSIKVIITEKLQLFFRHKQLLGREVGKTYKNTSHVLKTFPINIHIY